jgi:hypothetical protein
MKSSYTAVMPGPNKLIRGNINAVVSCDRMKYLGKRSIINR